MSDYKSQLVVRRTAVFVYSRLYMIRSISRLTVQLPFKPQKCDGQPFGVSCSSSAGYVNALADGQLNWRLPFGSVL